MRPLLRQRHRVLVLHQPLGRVAQVPQRQRRKAAAHQPSVFPIEEHSDMVLLGIVECDRLGKMGVRLGDGSHAMVARAMPAWGTMSVEGWQKVLNFAAGAGMLKDPSKAPSAQEGVLWTNKYVGQAP